MKYLLQMNKLALCSLLASLITGLHAANSHAQTNTTSDLCAGLADRRDDAKPIDIRIAFGYKDARPARLVADRYERAQVIQTLLQSCSPGRQACGFQRDPEDADVLLKLQRISDAKTRTVRLRITHSSAGPDDISNRTNRFQAWLTKNAEDNFHEGLREADMVFYVGHSRGGGGPDFKPPILRADNHVDYAWYEKNKEGLSRMKEALMAADQKPAVIGLLSCISNRHFQATVKKAAPKSRLLATDHLLYYAEAIDTLIESLDAALQPDCLRR